MVMIHLHNNPSLLLFCSNGQLGSKEALCLFTQQLPKIIGIDHKIKLMMEPLPCLVCWKGGKVLGKE